jgi:hypothetical protein
MNFRDFTLGKRSALERLEKVSANFRPSASVCIIDYNIQEAKFCQLFFLQSI